MFRTILYSRREISSLASTAFIAWREVVLTAALIPTLLRPSPA